MTRGCDRDGGPESTFVSPHPRVVFPCPLSDFARWIAKAIPDLIWRGHKSRSPLFLSPTGTAREKEVWYICWYYTCLVMISDMRPLLPTRGVFPFTESSEDSLHKGLRRSINSYFSFRRTLERGDFQKEKEEEEKNIYPFFFLYVSFITLTVRTSFFVLQLK